jgi:Flp pilus assembly protein TadG
VNSSLRAIRKSYRRARFLAARLLKDRSGIAATEFAVVVPLMLVMFFGTVEFSSAIAIKRKVTTMARTVSDLTSQASVVSSTDLSNFFAAGLGIMTPYPSAPTNTTVSLLYVDPSSGDVRVEWSQGSAPRAFKSKVSVPAGLISRDSSNNILANQYLIFAEVNYLYTPAVGYVLKSGVTLSDVAYTRPRQSTCVLYPSSTPATCPTS